MTYGDYPNLANVKKILVIKLRQLGDVLLTGPVFSAIKAKLPRASLDAYIYSEAAPLLEDHPAVDDIIAYDRDWKKLWLASRLTKERQMLQKIAQGKYDLVINLTEGDRGALAARYSRAPIRVGFDPKGSGLFGKKTLYTHIAKQCSSLRHTVERNLDAIRRIGIFPSQEERDLYFPLQSEALAKMRAVAGDDFLLIHPTSRWKFKCWPVEKMRELSQTLEKQGQRLVFTSGPDKDEKAMVDSICSGTHGLNLSGQISLLELGALIFLSRALLCVDSLPFHIASALKHPVVALFGPTSDITWGPWRNPHAKIIAQNFPCRPCYQDGCGGSKVSDCLATLPTSLILDGLAQIKQKIGVEI